MSRVGGRYIVTAFPESQKYKAQYIAAPAIPGYPGVMALGTNPAVSPLFSTTWLAGYWNFDEGTGSSTLDQSGNGNTGSWNGASGGTNNTHYVAGKVGSYMGSFDGTTNYIQIPSSTAYTSIQSKSMWVFISAAGNPYLMDEGGNDNWIQIASSHVRSATSGGCILDSTMTVALNTWYYITTAFDGATSMLYINGSLDSSKSCSGNSPGVVTIGSSSGGAGGLNGFIDDVRIYSRALSASEVAALYNAQK